MSFLKPSEEIRWLLREVRPFLRLQGVYLGTLFLSSILGLADPLIVKWIVDEIIPWRREEMLLVAGGTFFAIFVFRYSLSGLGSILDFYTSERVAFNIRLKLLRHLQRLSAHYHDNVSVGDILFRVEQDASKSASISGQVVTTVIRVTTTTLLTLLIMLFLSWKLTFFILPLVPALLFLRRFVYPRLRSSSDELQRLSGLRSGFLQDHLASIPQVQLLNQEARERRRFLGFANSVLESQVRQRSWDVFLMIASVLVSVAGIALSLTYGGFQVLNGSLTLGGLIAFYTYVTRFFDPLQSLASLYSSVQAANASIRRLRQVFTIQSEVQEKPDPETLPGDAPTQVEFRSVSFSYGERRVLEDINLLFEPGERVALVGESGCGKSTLVRLLTRLYDVKSGQILLNGANVKNLRLRNLRSLVSLVPQDPVLFDVTLRENLLYGKPSATARELEEAMAIAQLEDVVARIGFEEPVGPRGARLSGGERQRVALARAILRKSRILVLDESTSALDSHTEQRLLRCLEEVTRDRTVILVAHRLSVAMWAHRIVVLAGGRVFEQGSHRQLYLAGGLYRRLCEEQLRGDETTGEV